MLKLSLLLLCFVFSAQSFGQSGQISALKLKNAVAQKFHNGLTVQGLVVCTDGVLYPLNGYEIVFLIGQNKYVVKPQSAMVPNPTSGNFEVRHSGGLTMVCKCESTGPVDDCKYYAVPQGNDMHYHCGGTCSCSTFCFVPPNSILQYQTQDGNWH